MAKFKGVGMKREDDNKENDLFTVITEDEKEDVDEELLNSILSDDTLTQSMDVPNEMTPEAPAAETDMAVQQDTAQQPEFPVMTETEQPQAEMEDRQTEAAASAKNAAADSESVTVITKGTTINGSIASDCSLDVMGVINGDIDCLGKLTITGKVVGNAKASEVFINTERFEGNVTSEGCVKIGIETVVVGNIVSTAAVIAGAVKGDIDVQGTVVIDSSAIIKGNVKAKSVQMNNGAVLDGYCSLAYASVDIDKIFE